MNRFKYFLLNLICTPVYEGGDILVCYASQTGTAANLARQTGKVIRSYGKAVTVSSLEHIEPEDLSRYQQVLMIVSTCGEGELPDDGIQFYQKLMAYQGRVPKVGILALGDKSYAQFCRAGHLIHSELARLSGGLQEAPIMVDGNPAEPWRQWLESQLGAVVESAEPHLAEKPILLQLVERVPLHQANCSAGAEGNQAYKLVFDILDDGVKYSPGDLIAIAPPGEARERLYSVASAPSVSGSQLELCVGVLRYEREGQRVFGQCSHYLTQALEPGETISARWRQGHSLLLPAPHDPLIMVATGAGIAPMMCLLKERESQQHAAENWLVFGNRNQSNDFYYCETLDEMLTQGQVAHLDTAFSRDSKEKVYVQDVLRKQSDRLGEWLLEKNARLYVCGRKDIREPILDVLETALAQHLPNIDEAKGMVASLRQSGRICFELY